jgi:hypothetical protein
MGFVLYEEVIIISLLLISKGEQHQNLENLKAYEAELWQRHQFVCM